MVYEVYVRTKHAEESPLYSFDTMEEAKAYAVSYADAYWRGNKIDWGRPVECWQKIREGKDCTQMHFVYALYHVDLDDNSYIKIQFKEEP